MLLILGSICLGQNTILNYEQSKFSKVGCFNNLLNFTEGNQSLYGGWEFRIFMVASFTYLLSKNSYFLFHILTDVNTTVSVETESPAPLCGKSIFSFPDRYAMWLY